jgi:hypothetical protein
VKKPRRFVRMFQERFAGMVERGEKCRTIRKRPARMPVVGDVIDCRAWEGAAYRSKQRKLREVVLTEVREVKICEDALTEYCGRPLGEMETLDEFAQEDGFRNWEEMVAWFRETHGLPFEGVLLVWGEGTRGTERTEGTRD